MKLEKASWIASILAIPVAFVVWYFKPEEFTAFFKKAWNVIVSPFAAMSNWLAHRAETPVWVLLLLVFLGILLAIAIIWFMRFLQRPALRAAPRHTPTPIYSTAETVRPQIPPQPAPPARIDWHNYIQDEIFGVLWHWRYIGNTLDDSRIGALCPRAGCMNRLELTFDPQNPNLYRGHMTMPQSFVCNRCGFKQHFEFDGDTLRRRVCDEIERRVRTGEFEQSMNQQRQNG